MNERNWKELVIERTKILYESVNLIWWELALSLQNAMEAKGVDLSSYSQVSQYW